MKSAILAASAAVLLSGAASAQTVLYSQEANYGVGVPSDFNDGIDASMAVDDFTVPTGQTWLVTEVDAVGSYSSGGPASSFNVIFYKRGRGRRGAFPGNGIRKDIFQDIACTDNAGMIACTLPKVPKLKAGHYWVSVAANCPSGCQWLWTEDTVITTDPAAIEGDLCGGGGWYTLSECLGDSYAGDLAFDLVGTVN